MPAVKQLTSSCHVQPCPHNSPLPPHPQPSTSTWAHRTEVQLFTESTGWHKQFTKVLSPGTVQLNFSWGELSERVEELMLFNCGAEENS